MFKSSHKIALMLVCGMLASCTTSPSVYTDFDSAQQFSEYKSFAWISENPMVIAGDRGPSSMDEKRFVAAIEQTLKGKGYQLVDDRTHADFVVAFTVGARDRLTVKTREVMDYHGPHWGWGRDYYGFGQFANPTRTEVTAHKYSEGTLSIDIYDVGRKSPVWHGNAMKRLSSDELRGSKPASIQFAVEAILASFPPQ